MSEAPERIWMDMRKHGETFGVVQRGLLASPPRTEYIRADLVPQWQPIETAPLGADVLTWDGNDCAVLFWSKFNKCWTCGDPKRKYAPTHWMPLPPGPSA